MENVILILILLLAVGGALLYIYREKKKGRTCIGCPYAKECSKKSCQTNK
ncbi:MAG: FeoB-associated Cys-rich membrane protein [Clostridia bacterium]|nr:FeoB-associated Cys-rich membrane protein [Clostridia bacterium]